MTDRDILKALYQHTQGNRWHRNHNWNTPRPLDQWHGVGLTPGGHVRHLDLSFNNLQGNLPAALASLTALETLDLRSNNLGGPIPADLLRSPSLRCLYLSDNSLTGPLPHHVGEMTALEEMALDNNPITGPLPESLPRCTNLRGLYLSGCELTGAIPPALASAPSLVYLDLSDNDLEGPIPTQLETAGLRELHLAGNSLEPPVPPGLWQVPCNDLEDLSATMDHQVLTGHLIAAQEDSRTLEILPCPEYHPQNIMLHLRSWPPTPELQPHQLLEIAYSTQEDGTLWAESIAPARY